MTFHGRLEELSLTSVLETLSQHQSSGVLRLESNQGSAAIALLDGKLLWLEPSEHSLGDELVLAGALSAADYQDVLARWESGGFAIVSELGLDMERVQRTLNRLARELLRGLSTWNDGDFFFEKAEGIAEPVSLTQARLVVPSLLDVRSLTTTMGTTADEPKGVLAEPKVRSLLSRYLVKKFKTQTLVGPDSDNVSLEDFVDMLDAPAPSDGTVLRDLSEHDLSELRSILGELLQPIHPEAVLLFVLRFVSQEYERAALFVVEEDTFVGVGGFSSDAANPAFVTRLKGVRIPMAEQSVLATAVQFRAIYQGSMFQTPGNQALLAALGNRELVTELVTAPVVMRDSVRAVVYADNPSGQALGRSEQLEIFLQQAGLVWERAMWERELAQLRGR